MKIVPICILLIVLCSCGASINYDYDTTANFESYRSFNFYDDMESGLSVLDERRLKRALEDELKNMGCLRSDNPHFLINIKGVLKPEVSVSPSVDVGFGGTGGATSGGVGITVPISNDNSYDELIIEFVDEKRGETFWLADLGVILPNSTDPLKRDAYFLDLAEKVLSKYPPGSKMK